MSVITASSIVVIRTGDVVATIAERRGDFVDWIRRGIEGAWSGEVVTVDAREPLPAGLLDAAALILTGSPSSVTERAAWMLALEESLRAAHALDKPILGICFGHQILAQALGGEVHRNPKGREIGTIVVDRHHDDPLFEGLEAQFSVNSTHVDVVARLPEGARILATSSLDSVAAYALGRTRGVQFHPEMDGDVMRSLIETRRAILEAEGFGVEAMLAGAIDTHAGVTILQNFVRGFVAR